MADKLAEAVLEIRTDLTDSMKEIAALKDKLEDTSKSTKNINQLFSVDAITSFGKFAGETLLKVGGEILELGARGAAISDLRGRFGELAVGVGETSDAMLGELREGVSGTISDFELMQLANKTLGSGLVKTKEDMGTLAAGAKLLADRTGGDTKTAFDTLTSAIATGKTAQLKQLGIFVDTKAAVEEYAKAHGMATGDLNDTQRAAALSAQAVSQLRDQVERAGPSEADFGDALDHAKSSLTNMKDAIGEAIATSPGLMAGMNALGGEIDKALGSDQSAKVQALTGYVNSFALFLVDAVGVGVEGARYLTLAWDGLKVVFNGLATGVSVVMKAIVDEITWFVDEAAKLPGVGSKFDGLSASLHNTSQLIDGMRESFALQTTEALDGMSKTNAAFDQAQGVIGRVRTTVLTAGQAHIEAAAAAKTAAPDLAGDSLPERARANKDKITEMFKKLQDDIAAIGLVGVDQRKAQLQRQYDDEVAKIEATKGITVAEKEQALLLAQERYTREVEIAKLGSDQIRDTRLQLEQAIALGQTTGIQARMLELQFAQQAEIAQLGVLKLQYETDYTALVALVQAKYAQLTLAAQGHFATVQQAASAAGFQTQAELQHTADIALETYNRMKDSGLYTTETVKKAWEAAEKAKQAASKTTGKVSTDTYLEMASQATGVLKELFGDSKAVAIADVIINTARAVMQAFATYPPPASYVFAGLAAAMGIAQIIKIKSSNPGFAEGTPNLDYQRFGSSFPTTLHGTEAVVPEGGGHVLAGEIADALPAAQGSGWSDQVAAALRDLAAQMRQPMRGELQVDGRRLGEVVFSLSRTGALRVHKMAVVEI